MRSICPRSSTAPTSSFAIASMRGRRAATPAGVNAWLTESSVIGAVAVQHVPFEEGVEGRRPREPIRVEREARVAHEPCVAEHSSTSA
jgi:hypothetical protein